MTRRNRFVLLLLPGASLLLLVSCQSDEPLPVESGFALEQAGAAYVAYDEGDCTDVANRARQARIDRWPAGELRGAFALVRGFCLELDGESEAARETYRRIVRESPLTFASDDARERLRILRLRENDPDYASWVDAARDRALNGSSDRSPVERAPARFPPIASHAGVDGYAVVEFGVTPSGLTDAPVIVASEPPLLFDGSALRAVRAWRYQKDTRSTASQRQAIKLVFKPDSDDIETGGAATPAGETGPVTP